MKNVIEFQATLSRGQFQFDMKCVFGEGITGIYGPSGHGKTTLLQLISGLLSPDNGFIRIGDEVVLDKEKKIDIPSRNRKLGVVFQEGRLFPHLSVEENLRYGEKLLSKSQRHIQFDDVVSTLEIGHLLKKKPEQCSGGEQQRIAMGRALLRSPQLLLMDEPFSAVDVALREQILIYLVRIHRKYRIPMLVVSHDLPDILRLTDEILMVHDGRVEAFGKYLDLVLSRKMLPRSSGEGLLNVISLYVDEVDEERGITTLIGEKGEKKVKVHCEACNEGVALGREVKVSVPPGDIAISLHPVPEISIQNQLEGNIKRLLHENGQVVCLVDVGFPLLVELTRSSTERLRLEVGMKVFCLFKSMSVRVFELD
ncbi:molybdenum ABC transporter ATP-binding protein [Prolixibacter sp. NT017]|uniref:molybdenum ABC transporter ATP-binding protein n=1 Tax=Prolixibacter sp. NT017 TaxID=2652390 RepID=UPI0012705914|nr:molybdenum ABC transporter ATP-binding protein [Prolixibacter sp. NT017]GET26363.1 molybdenum import ATP-binding protein ModC [Prolixibacter sp. NT017]